MSKDHPYLDISDEEILEHLKTLRIDLPKHYSQKTTLGQRIADRVTKTAGSWSFLIAQSIVLLGWIIANLWAIHSWDPYPFILLNLVLSFQAAYTAPIILMSQNREAESDRQKMSRDYFVNLKALLEIELMQKKLDRLLEEQHKENAKAEKDFTVVPEK